MKASQLFSKSFQNKGPFYSLSLLLKTLALYSDYYYQVSFYDNGFFTIVISQHNLPVETVTFPEFYFVEKFLLERLDKVHPN